MFTNATHLFMVFHVLSAKVILPSSELFKVTHLGFGFSFEK